MPGMNHFTPWARPTNYSCLVTYYTSILNEQERSGLAMGKFADQSGLQAQTLYKWKRRLTAPTHMPVDEVEHTVGLIVTVRPCHVSAHLTLA
jgi:DNA-binding phage protein